MALGCSTGSNARAKPPERTFDHTREIVELLNARDFVTLAAAFPVPPEFSITEVDGFRKDMRRLLRTLHLEFGSFELRDRAVDGLRFYSVNAKAPGSFECHVGTRTFHVAFTALRDGMLRVTFCDDRPELMVGSLAFGLSAKRADAWREVVDVCVVTMMAMRWQTSSDVARRDCEKRIPQ